MRLMDAGRGLPDLGAGGRASVFLGSLGVCPRQLAVRPCRFKDASRSIVFITAQCRVVPVWLFGPFVFLFVPWRETVPQSQRAEHSDRLHS